MVKSGGFRHFYENNAPVEAGFTPFYENNAPVEAGFTPFYEDLVITHPVPQIDWICGETVEIKWNVGYNITNDVTTIPATPVSKTMNVYLGNVTSPLPNSDKIKKFLLAEAVDITSGILEYTVDCSELCPSCIVESPAVEASELYEFLYMEDANDNLCPDRSLNYDNDDCWSVRSAGAVNVGLVKRQNIVIDSTTNVWNQANSWIPEGNVDPSFDLPNLGIAVSHLTNYWLDGQTTITLPYGFGEFEIIFEDFRGVIGAIILKSLESNVVVVAFRATTGGPWVYDDWMTNFYISQNSCEGIDKTEPFLANCDENMKFHRGFLYEYEISKIGMRESLLEAVEADTRCGSGASSTPWRILFTGMSQGGGVAQVGFYDLYNHLKVSLDESYFNRLGMHLYTYGSPPAGNEVFALWVEETVPEHNRERYVVRFEGEYESAPYRWTDVKALGQNLIDFDTASPCLNVAPPHGEHTAEFAGWKWQSKEELGEEYAVATEEEVITANSVMWLSGDFISMMELSTSCIGYSLWFHLDSRYEEVFDPVYVHFDSDNLSVWCGPDGCDGTPPDKRSPPHHLAKAATSLYPNDMNNKREIDGCSYSGVRREASTSALSCHSMVNYAYGVAKWSSQFKTIIDYRYFGTNQDGCQAQGIELDRESGLPVSTITTTTESPGTDTSVPSNKARESVGLLGVFSVVIALVMV